MDVLDATRLPEDHRAEVDRAARAVIRRRGRRLVQHAAAAKASAGDGYGTDVTDLSSPEYKARIRHRMMLG